MNTEILYKKLKKYEEKFKLNEQPRYIEKIAKYKKTLFNGGNLSDYLVTLSGPVSIDYYTNIELNKKIIVLGDFHQTRDGQCPITHDIEKSVNISEYINNLKTIGIDLCLEHEAIEKVKKLINIEKNRISKDFITDIRKLTDEKSDNINFHFTDTRYDNLHNYIEIQRFLQYYDNLQNKLKPDLNKIVDIKYFDIFVNLIFERICFIIYDNYSIMLDIINGEDIDLNNLDYNISRNLVKEFIKIDSKYKKILINTIDKEIINNFLEYYNHKYIPTDTLYNELIKLYELILSTHGGISDIYLISRMLLHTGSNNIFYVGDAHRYMINKYLIALGFTHDHTYKPIDSTQFQCIKTLDFDYFFNNLNKIDTNSIKYKKQKEIFIKNKNKKKDINTNKLLLKEKINNFTKDFSNSINTELQKIETVLNTTYQTNDSINNIKKLLIEKTDTFINSINENNKIYLEELNAISNKKDETPSIIMIGNMGAGKSYLANVLLRENKFKSGVQPLSLTQKIQVEEINIENKKYNIIDIPGINDKDNSVNGLYNALTYSNSPVIIMVVINLGLARDPATYDYCVKIIKILKKLKLTKSSILFVFNNARNNELFLKQMSDDYIPGFFNHLKKIEQEQEHYINDIQNNYIILPQINELINTDFDYNNNEEVKDIQQKLFLKIQSMKPESLTYLISYDELDKIIKN
jgi:hypothetical protein